MRARDVFRIFIDLYAVPRCCSQEDVALAMLHIAGERLRPRPDVLYVSNQDAVDDSLPASESIRCAFLKSMRACAARRLLCRAACTCTHDVAPRRRAFHGGQAVPGFTKLLLPPCSGCVLHETLNDSQHHA